MNAALKNIKVMGILNATPDSFYDGGVYSLEKLTEKAMTMIEEGASIIDIGGESTRPGAEEVSSQEEMDRVLPLIEAIQKRSDIPISVDTRKSDIARESIKRGVDYINDVSGGRYDPKIFAVLAQSKSFYILMHSRSTPKDMLQSCDYENLISDIKNELNSSINKALQAGISAERLIIDPGFGFAKNNEQNLELLKNLDAFKCFSYPLLIGLSRKRFLSYLGGGELVQERQLSSVLAQLAAALKGAHYLRVHDVKETVFALRFWNKIFQKSFKL